MRACLKMLQVTDPLMFNRYSLTFLMQSKKQLYSKKANWSLLQKQARIERKHRPRDNSRDPPPHNLGQCWADLLWVEHRKMHFEPHTGPWQPHCRQIIPACLRQPWPLDFLMLLFCFLLCPAVSSTLKDDFGVVMTI